MFSKASCEHRGRIPIVLVLALAALVLLAGACARPQAAAPADNNLKVGLLPIIDSLPMWVAQRDGYFKAQNVLVELVNFASAMERDAAIQAGQLDGQLNDPISVGLLNKDRTDVKIVRLTYRGNPSLPMVSIVGSGKLRMLSELKGGQLALSQNTVMEYVSDSLLQREGISAADVRKTEVAKIPLRLEMLANGQIAAAVLPEPFTTLAVRQGAKMLANDGDTGLGLSVLVFRSAVLDAKPDSVRRFLKAYELAVADIAANPQRYRDLLVDQAKVPDAVRDTFGVPSLPKASVPREAELTAAFDWMTGRGLLTRKLPYAEVVDASFLPK